MIFDRMKFISFFLERYNNKEEIMYMGAHDFLSSLMEYCVSNKVCRKILFISRPNSDNSNTVVHRIFYNY